MGVFIGTSGNDSLIGTTGVDTLSGLDGNDTLDGSSGADLLSGGAGADSLIGGANSDIATYETAATGVSVNLTSGVHTGDAAGDTFSGIEVWRGSAFADTMTSSTGITTTFQGGDGDDLFIVDAATDVVTENAGQGLDEVHTSSASYTLSANVENLTYTGAGGFSGSGNASDNVLTGAGGADTLQGFAGADSFVGVGGVDVVTYAGAASGVSLNMTTGGAVGDAAGDTFDSIETILGSTFGDTLTGDGNANSVVGGAGNDVIDGGAGADTLDGGVGTADILAYTSASAAISMNFNTGVHTGDAAADVFSNFEIYQGSDYADTLTSSAVLNTNFRGGDGDDLFILDSASDVVTEAIGEGTDEVRTTSASYSLGANVENLTYSGGGAFSGVGNVLANVLTGGGGADTLTGGGGADMLDGGGGTDIASYATAAAAVTVNLGTGVHTGDATGDVFSSIEILDGSGFNDTLTGDGGANQLRGGAGNDVLEGGAGADTLDGGAGTLDVASYANAASGIGLDLTTGVHGGDATGDSFTAIEIWRGSAYGDTMTSSAILNTSFQGGQGDDLFILDSASDVATEAVGEGTDEVRTTSASYTLGANVENLTYAGGGAFNGVGNTLANVLTGGGGADTLTGAAGADTLDGGGGLDTASYAAATVGVTVNLATGVNTGDAAGDTFTSIENVEGSGFNDTLTGDAGDNNLKGGIGADVLEGGAGLDTLDGGANSDIASYAGAAAGITLNLATGVHTGDAAGDTFVAIETWRGTAFADTMTSSASTTGFQGGQGDDLYILDSTSDVVTESLGQGIDEVQINVTGYQLTTNVENLTLTGVGLAGLGNGLANVITGGTGNDTLTGGAGGDTLDGGGGIDTASYATAAAGVVVNMGTGVHTGDALGDTFISIEVVEGSGLNDTLTGDSSDNVLKGGIGNDVLEGGAGADTLDGGSGSTDIASYAGAAAGVSLNLATGAYTGDAAGDSFVGIEIYQGSAYADTLTSSASNTNFRGGQGDDVYVIDSTSDVVLETTGQGVDEVQTSTATYALGANVENLTYTGASNFSGSGNALDNVITGAGGNDTLQGFAGADSFHGGGGKDLVTFAGGSAIGVNLATGVNTGDATGDTFDSIETIVGSAGADTLASGAGDDNLQGGSGNDLLVGGAGADTLDGGVGTADVVSYAGASAGLVLDFSTSTFTGDAADDLLTNFEIYEGSAFADTMTSSVANTTFRGGTGDDLFVVDSASDVATENPGGGTDEVRTTSASYTLGANVEFLTFTGSGNFSGVGNASDNLLTGGGGDDTLAGAAGADTLSGGSGTDVATWSSAVSVNLATGVHTGHAAGDVFGSIEVFLGSSGRDSLTGDSNSNNLQGGQGDDLIEGGGGGDTLDGGVAGIDAVSYANAGAGISLDLSTGTYTGQAAGDVLTNFEAFIGTAHADTMTGGGGDEIFLGGGGADVFDGGGGANALWYSTSAAGVHIDLSTGAAGSGDATGDSFVNIQNVNGSQHDDTIIGDSGGNILSGSGGNDLIFGGDGDDLIRLYAVGGPFQQNLPADNASVVYGGQGNDSIAESSDDTGSSIYGEAGDDTLSVWAGDASGGDGNDTITAPGSANMFGDDGNDMITFKGANSWADGGQGSDTYFSDTSNGNAPSKVSDSGLFADIDTVQIGYAATTSDLYRFLDTTTDTMYFTSQSDINDNGLINSGVIVEDWSTHHIERLMAANGSFITI
jgi:Ca2+-binding RTX toxin-like protein